MNPEHEKLRAKQIPKQVKITQETKKYIEYICPNCEGKYYHYKRERNWFPRYCHNCGQRIEERIVETSNQEEMK
jgi:transcription elongation factor Elf1